MRQAYQAALSEGQGVTEWEPRGQAAAEVRALAEIVRRKVLGDLPAQPANDAMAPPAMAARP